MKTWLTATVLSASVLLCGGVALAYDLRGNPPIMQVVTTYGPLQIVGCTFNGIPNDAVQVSIMVRNRSAHKLVGFTARYRWYDPSDAKINDFTASYANLELDSGEKGSYLQTGGDGGSPIKRLVCSVTQATFGDGTTWVAGGKYHGKLLPFAAAAALRRDSLVSSMSMPMTSQPHDVDVKALLRLAVLYNVPTACNRSSADFLISAPLFFDRQHRLRRRADEPDLKAV